MAASERDKLVANLFVLRWQVPDVDDERPASHDVEQVTQKRLTTAVPERVSKPRVILTHTQTNKQTNNVYSLTCDS